VVAALQASLGARGGRQKREWTEEDEYGQE
jgi:hypothetical protein